MIDLYELETLLKLKVFADIEPIVEQADKDIEALQEGEYSEGMHEFKEAMWTEAKLKKFKKAELITLILSLEADLLNEFEAVQTNAADYIEGIIDPLKNKLLGIKETIMKEIKEVMT